MERNEEQIGIVYSVSGTCPNYIDEAKDAVRSYRRDASFVMGVFLEPWTLQIPSGSQPGGTLGSELTRRLRSSIGAIVFVDDLRPNVAYELGFFHGQGRAVLLVTNKRVEQIWASISDLAGCALLSMEKLSLVEGVHSYLDGVYDALGDIPLFQAPELPHQSRNIIGELAERARIRVEPYEGDFGETLRIDTWGGVVFEVGYSLLADAKFKIAIRGESRDSTYSIYFCIGSA